jgi:hypothetical protein
LLSSSLSDLPLTLSLRTKCGVEERTVSVPFEGLSSSLSDLGVEDRAVSKVEPSNCELGNYVGARTKMKAGETG